MIPDAPAWAKLGDPFSKRIDSITTCRVLVPLNGSFDIHRRPVPSIAISEDRNLHLSIDLLDLETHVLHGDVSGVGETLGRGDVVARDEDEGETGFLAES